jgi:hypothetical protein
MPYTTIRNRQTIPKKSPDSLINSPTANDFTPELDRPGKQGLNYLLFYWKMTL